ncbi:hypothetical protein NJ76_28365 [Rhodococcus sp. IITR03]|nr:hypothetical protein NJ76_28365 [Rhodococcus sp. IITR03]
MVPINTRLTSAEVSALVDDCSPRVIVWSSGHYDVVSRSLADSASVVIGPTPDNTPHGTRTFDSLVHEGEQLPDVSCTVHGEHAFILGYTSGTTGKPKGAVLTHQSVAAIAESNNNAYRLPERSVCALTGSMSFVATVPAHILTHLASAEAW